MRRHAFAALSCIALFVALPCLHAQERYPSRPIKLIVPSPAGGPTDAFARMLGERLSQDLGQPVVVDNRPGASLIIGTTAVAKADPDGYSLLFTTSSPIVQVPYTVKNVPYDVQKDLTAISHLGSTPLVLYVNASSNIANLKQLFDAAREKPASANYGSVGNGSSFHILGEYMVKQAGVSMVHVPYKSVIAQLQDLVGGQLLVATADISAAAPLVKAGKVRPIAVTGAKRTSLMPDVPTFTEQGIVGMEPFVVWWGVFAPQKTPPPIIEQLSAAIIRFMQLPETRAKLVGFGAEPTGTSAAQANEITRQEMARWQQIIRDLPQIKFD